MTLYFRMYPENGKLSLRYGLHIGSGFLLESIDCAATARRAVECKTPVHGDSWPGIAFLRVLGQKNEN